MQVKLFSGDHEKVERAINRWADDGSARQIVSIMPLPAEKGDVALMFIFNPVIPGVVVPTSKIQMPNGVN